MALQSVGRSTQSLQFAKQVLQWPDRSIATRQPRDTHLELFLMLSYPKTTYLKSKKTSLFELAENCRLQHHHSIAYLRGLASALAFLTWRLCTAATPNTPVVPKRHVKNANALKIGAKPAGPPLHVESCVR